MHTKSRDSLGCVHPLKCIVSIVLCLVTPTTLLCTRPPFPLHCSPKELPFYFSGHIWSYTYMYMWPLYLDFLVSSPFTFWFYFPHILHNLLLVFVVYFLLLRWMLCEERGFCLFISRFHVLRTAPFHKDVLNELCVCACMCVCACVCMCLQHFVVRDPYMLASVGFLIHHSLSSERNHLVSCPGFPGAWLPSCFSRTEVHFIST